MRKLFLLSCASVMLFVCYTGNTHAYPLPDLTTKLTAYVSSEPIDFGNLSSKEQNHIDRESTPNPTAMPGDYITYIIKAINGTPRSSNYAHDVRVVFRNDAGLNLNAWWYYYYGVYTYTPFINVNFGPDHAIWAADRMGDYEEVWFAISASIDPDYDQNTIVSSVFAICIDPEYDISNNKSISEISIVSSVPEPTTLLLLGTGLAGIVGVGRKKSVKKQKQEDILRA